MNDTNRPKNRGPVKRNDTFARRVVPALTLVGVSGGLLAALDRPSDGLQTAAGPPIGTGSTATTVTVVGATVAPDPMASTVAPTVVPQQNTSAPMGNVPITAAPVTAAPATTVPPAPTPAACAGMVLGPTISTKYGPVQVQASVDGTGYVCSAQGVVWPTEDRKSVDINNQAIPLLNEWAGYQHDASFNSISGATITSKAYKQSLQAIIDQARA